MSEFTSYAVVKKSNIVKCKSCGFVFSQKIDLEYLDQLYKKYYHDNYEPAKVQMWIDRHKSEWQEIVSNISSFKSNIQNILDVGAGTGGFLGEFCKKYPNTKINAIETSTKARETIKSRFPGITFQAYSVDEMSEVVEKFDVVTILQSLEHIINPLELLKETYRILAADGIAIVTIPNRFSYEVLLKGKEKSHCYGHETHLQYFDNKTFIKMSKSAGFEEVTRLSKYPLANIPSIMKIIRYSFRKLGISTELRYVLKK